MKLRDSLFGNAYYGPGVHDGIPGGSPACAGTCFRSGGLRLGGDERRSKNSILGEAPGQERASEDGEAISRRSKRDCSCYRLQHLSNVERLSGPLCQSRNRQCSSSETAPKRNSTSCYYSPGYSR